jgi:hypothetical protein
MPTNTQINSSLVAGTVPPDRDCPRTGQQVVNLVQDFMSIQSSGGGNDPLPPDNSIAELALNTANTALAEVQALTAAQKQFRDLDPQPLPTGDNTFVFSFAPPMPSTDYSIGLTLYDGASPAVHPAAYYGVRVIETSITVSGFSVLLDNIPTATKLGIRIVER